MWLTLALLAAADLVIRSTTNCPGAADVVAQITPLLPPGVRAAVADAAPASRNGDQADLSLENGIRWVRLRGHDRRSTQERALPEALTCAEAAKTAAVLLAAWEFQGQADLPAEAQPPVAPPPRAATGPLTTNGAAEPEAVSAGPAGATPAPPPSAPASAEPTPDQPRAAPIATPAPPAPPVRSPAPVAVPVRPAPPSAPAQPLIGPTTPQSVSPASGGRRLSVGAGLSLGSGGDDPAASALVEAALAGSDGLSLRAQAATSSQYSLAVGPGRASWTRSSLGLGAALAHRWNRWGAEAHGYLLAALLTITGQGFALNENGSQRELGAGVGGRGILRMGRADLWFDVTLTAWPGRHEVTVRDVAQSRTLPVFEVGGGLGVDFFVWP